MRIVTAELFMAIIISIAFIYLTSFIKKKCKRILNKGEDR